jgi:cytochrome c oxidase assembly protein subunit 15
MTTSSPAPRTGQYRAGLAWFAGVGTLWVFVLVFLGAYTTSTNSGMAFPDWPLSNGSVNPPGWLTELDKFAEHSHRLSATLMGLITIAIAVWVHRTDSRAWLRRLALFAVGLVVFQGVVGGLRVLLDGMHVNMVNTSVGRLFAMLHACLAQLFVCNLIAIACACSRAWIERPLPMSDGVRRLGVICCGFLFTQLAIAAVVRHSFAGLAIPTFPYSTPDGGILPAAWSFPVAIHFAHRAMAAVLAVFLVWFALKIRLDREAPLLMRGGATLLIVLLGLQITLGAEIIWTFRKVALTTGHVLVGALTLALAFTLTWLAHRDPINDRPE